MTKAELSTGPLVQNKKVFLNYEITDKYEAGLSLQGHEVKSLRNKLGSLDGSYVTIRGGEAFLINSFIPPYQEKNTPESYDPRRNRKLLLSKGDITMLAGIEKKKGLTIVPISVYNSRANKLKVEIGIARGKKEYDKRETIKKRTVDREIRREFSER
jgi:SsrA-binding protein